MPENQTWNLLVKKDWFYIIISWSVLMLGFIGILYYAPGYLRQLRSRDPAQYRMAGLQFYNEKKYDQAVEKIEYGLKIAPDNPELNVLMGRSLDKLKQFEKAEIYLKKAISENPKEKRYWYALNWHYFDSNQLSKAEKLWLAQTIIEPNNVEYNLQLAFVYERMKQPQKAVDIYQKIYMIDSKSIEAQKGLARNYVQLGNDDKAMVFWKEVITKQPNDPEAWYNIGSFWNKKKDFIKAEDAYKKALSINGSHYYYNISLARLYFSTNSFSNISKAEKYLAQCTTVSSNEVEPYYRLGLIQRDIRKNYPLAINLFTKAINIKEDAYSFRDLGMTYEKINKPQEAVKAYKKVLEIDPSFPVKDRITRLSKS